MGVELVHWPTLFYWNFQFVCVCRANYSKGVACEKIKYFPSNGSLVVRFASYANHRCGSRALSRTSLIMTDEPLNARHARTLQ
jgi:hypothetical protein